MHLQDWAFDFLRCKFLFLFFVIKFFSFLFASIGFTTNICIVNIREGHKVKNPIGLTRHPSSQHTNEIFKSLSGQTRSLKNAWNFNFDPVRDVYFCTLFSTLYPSLSLSLSCILFMKLWIFLKPLIKKVSSWKWRKL